MIFSTEDAARARKLGWTACAAAVALSLGEGIAVVTALSLVLILCGTASEPPARARLLMGRLRGLQNAMKQPLLVCLTILGLAGLLPLVGRGTEALLHGLARLLPIAAAILAATVCSRLSCQWRRRVAHAFFIGAAAAALFGILQYILDVRPGEAIARTDAFIADQALIPGTTQSVAGGFYFHRLKLAHLLVLAVGPVTALMIVNTRTRVERLVTLGLLTLFASALALTFARGALLAIAIGTAALVVQAPSRRRRSALALVVLLALPLSLHPGVRARLHSATGAEARGVRSLIWSEAARVIRDFPSGCGWGQYRETVRPYYRATHPHFRTVTLPHNVLLAIWAESGPVGLAAYLMTWALILARAWEKRATMPEAALITIYFIAAFWVLASTHDVFFHQIIGMAYGAFGGWMMVLLRGAETCTNRARVG